MDTSALTPGSLTGQLGAGAGAGGSQSIGDTFDNFLTLLTTQLKNQDPISPMDTSEFTNQLVQFTEVEQSINTNDKLDSLIGLQSTHQLAFAASLTGKQVEFAGDALRLGADGALSFGYFLPSGAETVEIEIVDAVGNVVHTVAGETAAGAHVLAWDGTNRHGERQPQGTYRIDVTGTDAEGAPIEATSSVHKTVVGVELDGSDITLDVGDHKVPLSNVLAIRDSAAS